MFCQTFGAFVGVLKPVPWSHLDNQDQDHGSIPKTTVKASPLAPQTKSYVARRNSNVIISKVGGPQNQIDLGPFSVSKIGVGTWSWGNKLLWNYDESIDDELERTFNTLVQNGINLFDTADSYGTGKLNGRSESLLGKFSGKQSSKFDSSNVHIATKFAAYPWRITRSSIVKACKESLQRLDRDRIDIGQLHWSTQNYAPWQERALWDGIGDIYELGLVSAIGLSNYGPQQLRKIHQALTIERSIPIATCQVQLSLLSLAPLKSGLLPMCQDLGIQLIGYSPLALGILSGKYDGRSRKVGGFRGLALNSLASRSDVLLGTLREIAQARNKTVAQVAVNWVKAKGAIPIPGAKNVQEARDHVDCLLWDLTAEEVSDLERAARRVKGQATQNIFMTK